MGSHPQRWALTRNDGDHTDASYHALSHIHACVATTDPDGIGNRNGASAVRCYSPTNDAGGAMKAPSIVPAKPKALPRPGQRTYLGCAYLYIERAMEA
jgi:hypothetical protein